MSFPNHPDKQRYEALLKAEDIVAYRRRLGRMPAIDPLGGDLLCLERGLPERMRWRIPVRRAGSMNADVYATRRTKNPVAVLTHFGGGSPMVAELAEELAVMGAKKMLLMTWGGTLQPDLQPGDIVICNAALRDEGTSQHYLPPGKTIQADPGLVQKLEQAIRARGASSSTGVTWTTDAPYRETREEVCSYQSEGVKVVEMEAAGLFTIGQTRSLPTAAVVVVMDSLAALVWKAPERLDGIMRSLEVVYSACIEVLAQD